MQSSNLIHTVSAPAESVLDPRPRLLLAVDPTEVDRFLMATYRTFVANTTTEALGVIERWQPRLVLIDWDCPTFNAPAIVARLQRIPAVGILVVTAVPKHAPAALKAGCHSLLLKPLSINLVAARLGRVLRELPAATAASRMGIPFRQRGTHQECPDVWCPQCNAARAICFDYSSCRRAWFACRSCEHTWLGRRRD